jgi:hypothetical protein
MGSAFYCRRHHGRSSYWKKLKNYVYKLSGNAPPDLCFYHAEAILPILCIIFFISSFCWLPRIFRSRQGIISAIPMSFYVNKLPNGGSCCCFSHLKQHGNIPECHCSIIRIWCNLWVVTKMSLQILS